MPVAKQRLLASQLTKVVDKRCKFFLVGGKAYTTTLREYDDEVAIIDGEHDGDPQVTVFLDHVSAFMEIYE
jgi:hypothetical protein